MLRKDIVPDRKITENVTKQLMGRGIRAPSHVNVMTSGGAVTLTGKVQYQHQKAMAVQAAQGVDGTRRVVDQLEVLPRPPQPKF